MLFLFIKYYKNKFIFDIIFMVNNMISKRLQEIAKYVYPYKKIADVGCDHGYLIIEAIKKYNVTNCIAIDNKEGPLNVAKYNITNVGYLDKVRFSLSSGITDIDNDMSNLDGSHPDIWNGRAQDILYNHYKNVHVNF